MGNATGVRVCKRGKHKWDKWRYTSNRSIRIRWCQRCSEQDFEERKKKSKRRARNNGAKFHSKKKK